MATHVAIELAEIPWKWYHKYLFHVFVVFNEIVAIRLKVWAVENR